jgi:hypothetical protein
MKYKYTGTDERVFPTLGITVQPGDEFDAPANLSAHDVTSGAPTKPVEAPKPSAPSDLKVGE